MKCASVPFVHAASGGSTTYGELTVGVTWKPALPPPVTGLLVRPEMRWDHAFTNNHPFNASAPHPRRPEWNCCRLLPSAIHRWR
jgi:hypothetical protein